MGVSFSGGHLPMNLPLHRPARQPGKMGQDWSCCLRLQVNGVLAALPPGLFTSRRRMTWRLVRLWAGLVPRLTLRYSQAEAENAQ